tara:strand:- start:222 stop:530 length:309 start_codon:yes stop_codon:yes gene_type:complete
MNEPKRRGRTNNVPPRKETTKTDNTQAGEEVECKSLLAERDQLMEIAMLMDKHFIHEKTDNSLTVESVEAMIQGLKDAWMIMDNLECDKADEWQNEWQDILS